MSRARLLGATVTALAQLWALRIGWRNERRGRQLDDLRGLYLEYLEFLLNLPNEIYEGAVEGDGHERRQRFARRMNAFRAQLMLGPSAAVRERSNDLPSAYEQFLELQSELADQDLQLEREERQGIVSTTVSAFRETFEPAVFALAQTMREDVSN